jgi:hypothetical protein
MNPTIGRIVHFTASDGDPGPYAGIIVAVHKAPEPLERVDLVTFGPNSLYHNHNVPYSEEPKAGHWNWPPRS